MVVLYLLPQQTPISERRSRVLMQAHVLDSADMGQ